MQNPSPLELANTVLIQELLTPEETELLRKEFPLFKFITPANQNELEEKLPPLADVVVLYSNTLSTAHLRCMSQLRWIHCPTPHLSDLPLNILSEMSQITITRTQCENLSQIQEYVIGALLALAKQLFHWAKGVGTLRNPWETPPPQAPWNLRERTFLQIGLGKAGTQIAAGAEALGMKVWGCDLRGSFHPHCQRVYPMTALHSLLPAVDVVSLCMPRSRHYAGCFGEEELALLRDDRIIIVVGSGNVIDEKALASHASRFRGVVLDVFSHSPLPRTSPLWEQPTVLITPEVSTHPESNERLAFHSFRHNLRHFIHRNVLEMENVVERPFQELFI